MTPAILAFVEALRLEGKCLDVGAFDVNGNPRHLFNDYTGVDQRPGPNVDVVARAAALPFPDGAFDVVLCLEMLEHDPAPWVSMRELDRVLRPGGTLVLTAPGIGFPPHDYPLDYWRFTQHGLRALLAGIGETHTFADHDHVYAVCRKPHRQGLCQASPAATSIAKPLANPAILYTPAAFPSRGARQ
jgi:SAM-dependent methyltransferase